MSTIGRAAAMAAVMVGLVFSGAGCAYLHTQRPLSTQYDRTELGTKEGRASAYSLLWLVAWGDCGNAAAARQGGIKVIRMADMETKLVLFGLYTRVTTVVYGD